MIGRMFERIPAWAIGVVAMVFIVVLIYAAGWWWAGWPAPRWKCDDGYWHWRSECRGHQDFLAGARVATVAGEDRDGATEGSALRPHPDNAEAALDEAWPEQLHRINEDIRIYDAKLHRTHTNQGLVPGNQTAWPVIDWAGMSWRDRSELERWDWGRRMAADGAEWMHRMDVERHAWRSEMGLAA